MVDNFKLIKDQLVFDSPDDFYFLQIIQRKKDGLDQNGDQIRGTNNKARAIKNYVIKSSDYLDKIESEVKHLCDYFNSRAMIILSKKSFERVALYNQVSTAELILNKQYENIKNVYWSSCAKAPSKDKYFLIDIDEEDMDNLERIKHIIEYETENSGADKGNRIKCVIPSKHGCHLITHPFDSRSLLTEYSKLKEQFIHVNGPTLLYAP